MRKYGAFAFAVIGGFLIASTGRGKATGQAGADVDAPAIWGSASVDGGQCCQTLGEVRANIDRIDNDLVELMAERGMYVHEAARFKQNPLAVEDKGRVEAIVRKVRALAGDHHLNPDVAEKTYRAMISEFTKDERKAASEMMLTPAR